MYFAQIDNNNIVLQVVVADQDFINAQTGTWIQTDINGLSPMNYAGIGYTWNASLNAFISPQPYPSFSLDSQCKWQAPVAYPSDGKRYVWDESSVNWVLPS
jgi:hypothetical protein